jgi:hypothetical protein
MCVLGILLAIMLCIPGASAAGSDDTGSWNFQIVTIIYHTFTEIKLNGQGDVNGGYYQNVIVPNSLENVEVQFVVTGGPDTTINVTKEYIAELRREKPDETPTIHAWGEPLMYDVDAGWGTAKPFNYYGWNEYGVLTFCFTPNEHLVKRGLRHYSPGHQYGVDMNHGFHNRHVTA